MTDESVKTGVSEFFFTLGPSRLTRAVQAVIDPIGVYRSMAQAPSPALSGAGRPNSIPIESVIRPTNRVFERPQAA